MPKYQALRKQYPKFIYHNYDFQLKNEQLEIVWHFYLQDKKGKRVEFKPRLTVPLPPGSQLPTPNLSAKTAQLSADSKLQTLIFNLGMVELLSYWKLTASPEIIIQAGNLNEKQLAFWQKLLTFGMGEYFYLNQIPFWEKDFVKFKTGSSTRFTREDDSQEREPGGQKNLTSTNLQSPARSSFAPADAGGSIFNLQSVLIPLGGGKDSIVTLELLKKYKKEHNQEKKPHLTTFAINPTDAIIQTAKIAQLPLVSVKRQLDPKLLELNQKGFLNGHTPFSALVAFTTELVAYLYRFDQIALSNESSANEPTLDWHGHPINHQYSKSFQFETDFKKYIHNLEVTSDTKLANYFSFLRPLPELAIAKLFSQVGRDYFFRFRSCNIGQKKGIWCNHCPKCLFAFSMIFPFVGESTAISIWGENLFEKKSLLKTAYQLVGAEVDEVKNEKPFECVGTRLESLTAFWLATKWYKEQKKPLPYILKKFQANIFPKYQELDKKTQKILNTFDKNNYLPEKLKKFLGSKLKSESVAQMRNTNDSVGVALKSKPDREFAKQMSERLTLSKTEILSQVQSDNVVLILGLGREGLSSFNFLINQGVSPEKIILVDDKPKEKLSKKWQETIRRFNLRFKTRFSTRFARENDVIVIKSPGVPPNHPLLKWARKHNVKVTSNTQLFFEIVRSSSPIIIGITGTKGKSTTSALIHHILKKAGYSAVLGGNVGTPPLDIINLKLVESEPASLTKPKGESIAQMRSANGSIGVALKSKPDREFAKQMSDRLTTSQPIYVLELSSHQLQDLNQSLDIAVWLNVYPEHLDYYPNFNAYVQAKTNIFKHQTPDNHLVYLADDPTINKLVETAKAKLHPFSKDQADKLNLTQIKLVGRHNKLNLLASIKVASIFGINSEKALKLAKDFTPLPHRLEKVATINHVTYINDSLATNPQATIAALKSFTQPSILITGGYDRGLDYTLLAKAILTRLNIKTVILLPETGEKIMKLIKQFRIKFSDDVMTDPVSNLTTTSRQTQLQTYSVSNLTEAVALAKKIAQPNDVVLLSPASASFNQFKDYRQRGEAFRKLVKS